LNLLGTGLEASLRVMVALDVLQPERHSIDDLMVFDHLCMHSADFDGPESLHPALPLRAADLGARRAQVRTAVELLAHRGLAQLYPAADSIQVMAGLNTRSVVASLRASYLKDYRARARWVRDGEFISTPERASATLREIVSTWSTVEGSTDDSN
jgi:hypothetical protein